MPKDRTKENAGGLKRQKTITIAKPDLNRQKYFNSKHTTPDLSIAD